MIVAITVKVDASGGWLWDRFSGFISVSKIDVLHPSSLLLEKTIDGAIDVPYALSFLLMLARRSQAMNRNRRTNLIKAKINLFTGAFCARWGRHLVRAKE